MFFSIAAIVGPASSKAEDLPALVLGKCSGCHAPPSPQVMERYAWPKNLNAMKGFMAEKQIPFTDVEFQEISDFYASNSPEDFPPIVDDLAETKLLFTKQAVGSLPLHARPQVTSVKANDVNGDGKSDEMLVTDNLNHSVSWLRREGELWVETILGTYSAPVNTTAMDIDGDGDIDYGISCMGQMHPNDEMIGEFHLLINEGGGKFTTHPVITGGIARITDCAPADYDGDGDMDIVLACFGWRKTGAVVLLEQTAALQFNARVIAEINGLMRVIPSHLDDDDRMDFLALVTQQHEMVIRFHNQGNLAFQGNLIARANHPTFGSSSIALSDLDQDGDDDILWTNGDMMDENPVPKPYHGVRWLENDKWNYTLHHLAFMPGCYDAKPCDLDGDGDLDIVYSALYFQWKEADFPSLAWLENTGEFKTFVARKIDYAPTNLVNISVLDVNGDGKLDIVGGGMHVPGPVDRAGRLTLWLQGAEEPRIPVAKASPK